MTFTTYLFLLLMAYVAGLMCGQYGRLPRFRRRGPEQGSTPPADDPALTFVAVVHVPWYEEPFLDSEA
jgi:hypothetical protein